MPSEVVLLEHYKELNNAARQYDSQFWIIPGLFFTSSIGFYTLIFSIEETKIENLLFWVNPILGLCFALQMINERAYQIKNKTRMRETRRLLGLDNVIIPESKKWVECWTMRMNLPAFMIAIVLIITIAEIAIAYLYTS